jgi:hypothetical protein
MLKLNNKIGYSYMNNVNTSSQPTVTSINISSSQLVIDYKGRSSPAPGPAPAPGPGPAPGPAPSPALPFVFEIDLLVYDQGYQPEAYPDYIKNNPGDYMNVAGISFIQPSDLMNVNYDLDPQVATVVNELVSKKIIVQLLIGGETSTGWSDLASNPTTAITTAKKLMEKYKIGMEVDNESGSGAEGVITFIEGLRETANKLGTYLSMDVAGTPTADQTAVIKGAINNLDWVNMMVSVPSYDQQNSITYGIKDGIPKNKLLIAFYGGGYIDNCSTMGDETTIGTLAQGLKLKKDNDILGLSVWAICKCGSYKQGGCSGKGFLDTMAKLKNE